MPRRAASVSVATGAAAVALFGVTATGLAAEGHDVAVVDNAFDDGDDEPTTTRVTAGDRVVWRWDPANANPHTVTALDGSFDSDAECAGGSVDACREPGTVFGVTFTEPGIFHYRCKVHPNMLGVVEVAAASETPSEDEPDEGATEGSEAPTDAPRDGSPAEPDRPVEDPSRSAVPDREPRTTTTASAEPSVPPRGQARRLGLPAFGPAPTPSPPPRAAEVASPAPTADRSYEPFPTAPPLPTEDPSAGIVEVPTGRTSRPVLTGIAAASLLGSAGAVLRVILRA